MQHVVARDVYGGSEDCVWRVRGLCMEGQRILIRVQAGRGKSTPKSNHESTPKLDPTCRAAAMTLEMPLEARNFGTVQVVWSSSSLRVGTWVHGHMGTWVHDACMCACVHACMRACVYACVYACVHGYMRTWVHGYLIRGM